MFGSALGSADNGYQVADGRFTNVSSIYDPNSLLVSTLVSPVHNPYGYISGTFDYQVRAREARIFGGERKAALPYSNSNVAGLRGSFCCWCYLETYLRIDSTVDK